MDWNGIYNLTTRQRQPTNDYEFGKPNVPGLGASLTFSDAETSNLGFMNEEGSVITVAAEDRINHNEFSVWKYLASITHYIKIGEHSVLEPRFRMLGSSHLTQFDRSYAILNGKNTGNVTDRGTYLGLGSIGIRGYSDQSFYTRAVGIGGVDFNFPIDQIYRGISDTFPAFLKQMHGFVFADAAYIPSSRFKNLFLPSFGGGVSLDTTLLIRAPITFNFEVQNGTKKDFGGDELFFFSVQSASLF